MDSDLARQNRSWGYTRIQGALQNLGHQGGRGTIAKILKEAGGDPALDRQRKDIWKEFLRIRLNVLAAADFFSVEVWTALGLVRYHVLFVIRLAIPSFAARWNEQAWLIAICIHAGRLGAGAGEARLEGLRADYELGTCPERPEFLVLTVDVQRDCVYYVVRAWGNRMNPG